jgi:lipopolysaccharide export system permease protein
MLFFSAFIIGTFYITILDKVSACSVMKIKSIKAKINERDVDKSLTVTNSGIWLKDINGSESHIIYAKSFNRESASLFNVRFFNLNANNELQKSLYSREAAIFDGFWQLREAEVVGDSNEKQLTLIQIPTKLSFHDITKMVENPNSISFWSMKKYINMLDKTGLSSTKHKIYWLSKISSIVQMFTLIMFATVFCVNYNPRNVKRYVEKIALLLGMAFPMHFFDNVLVAFGENGVIPTDFSMFVVPIFTIATSCIFLHKS